MCSNISEVVKLTRDLVKIPSVNPDEKKISDFIYNWFVEEGIDVEQVEVLEGRKNVIACLRGNGESPALLLLSHMDTVPVGNEADWSYGCYSGEVTGDRMYGRGSADMKSGAAITMTAIKKIKEMGLKLKGDLIVAVVIDEEAVDYLGAQSLVETGIATSEAYILCTEPTGLELHGAQKGTVWYEIDFFGKNAHGGNPQFGIDSVKGMSIFLNKVNNYISSLPYEQLNIGKASVCMGKIKGGVKINMVPDSCHCEIDIRIPKPLTSKIIDETLTNLIEETEQEIPGLRWKIKRISPDRDPVEADSSSVFYQKLLASYKSEAGEDMTVSGFSAYTDAGVIATMTKNPNCIIFGPGKLENAHKVDEYVDLAEIDLGERVLVKLAELLLG